MKALAVLGAATAAIMTADPAAATTLLYTLYGLDTGGADPGGDLENSSWYLDSNPTVDDFIKGNQFTLANVAGNFNYGPSLHADSTDLTFYNIGAAAPLYDPTLIPNPDQVAVLTESAGIVNVYGPKLYSGPESAPTLLTGNFTVHDYFSGAAYSLKVEAVPEAATWAMMLAGFGLVGCAFRARRTTVKFA